MQESLIWMTYRSQGRDQSDLYFDPVKSIDVDRMLVHEESMTYFAVYEMHFHIIVTVTRRI